MSISPYAGPVDRCVLTPVQQKVAALLAAGSTAARAAQAAGIHRNTIANWRRRPALQAALSQATRAHANLWRDQTDARVLLQAALALLDRQAPPPADFVPPVHNPAQSAAAPPPHQKSANIVIPCHPAPQPTEIARNEPTVPPTGPTQPPPDAGIPAAQTAKTIVTSSRPLGAIVQPVHNSAQSPAPLPKIERSNPISPIVRLSPKIGRNPSCPCGSGRKFKKCCLHAAPEVAP